MKILNKNILKNIYFNFSKFTNFKNQNLIIKFYINRILIFIFFKKKKLNAKNLKKKKKKLNFLKISKKIMKFSHNIN